MKKKLFFPFFLCALYLSGCATPSCDLTELDLPWQISGFGELDRSGYQDGRQGTWEYHIDLALKLNKEAEQYLDKSASLTHAILLRENPKNVETKAQLSEIKQAVEQKKLISYGNLSTQQVQEISQQWKGIYRAESYALYGAIIIAELRQKWLLIQEHCDIAAAQTGIAKTLPELPSIASIEQRQDQLETLKSAFLQLSIANETVQIPSEEAVRQEDQNIRYQRDKKE